MKLLKLFAVSLAIMALSASAFAQTRELTGVVKDATDFPLEGVAVIVDGTANGVMTSGGGQLYYYSAVQGCCPQCVISWL